MFRILWLVCIGIINIKWNIKIKIILFKQFLILTLDYHKLSSSPMIFPKMWRSNGYTSSPAIVLFDTTNCCLRLCMRAIWWNTKSRNIFMSIFSFKLSHIVNRTDSDPIMFVIRKNLKMILQNRQLISELNFRKFIRFHLSFLQIPRAGIISCRLS